jgi:hypothetical protein
MLARRMLMFVALLFVVTALAAGLAPPPRTRTQRFDDTSPPRGRAVVLQRTLDAAQPKPRVLTVRTGDVLSLTVRSDTTDAVELQGLGALRPIDPSTPVTFDVLPEVPGEYPVVLVDAARTVGTVRVVTQPG